MYIRRDIYGDKLMLHTGMTALLAAHELSPMVLLIYFRYNKTEDLKPGGNIMMSYTHIVTGNSSHLAYYKHSHDTLDTVSGFVGISLNRQKLPFLSFKTDPKIWILARKRK